MAARLPTLTVSVSAVLVGTGAAIGAATAQTLPAVAALVVAVAIHAPIGLRAVLREWTRWRWRALDVALAVLAVLLLVLGARAVYAVTLA